ncbi:uncharacterized protein LOC112593472 [Melanaphis sacchari]|uniref:uncharacterized protein LOC112593472 n=1 Tax=Melanaphis sacchari TaxID=742174 RepID=UPI000DC1500F|nr:uncharacterized protein LOC112593472 [Melanaphis sacchari]
MNDEQEVTRVERVVARSTLRRTTVVSQIRRIHAMALRVPNEPLLGPEFSMNAADLDSLWIQFKSENDEVLDGLSLLGRTNDYSPDLPSEVRQLINAAKAVATNLIPKGAEAIDLSYIQQKLPSISTFPLDTTTSSSRLPEIPLPSFSGDFREWPGFRDKFSMRVDVHPSISTIDKMYYLISCLKGSAAEAVQGIPVAADNYQLVWSTLSNRFNRPRLVASSILEQLLHASTMTQESLSDLSAFVGTFHENQSLLTALKIPDIGSFILFSMAFRCLPVHTRKLFEAQSTADYPTLNQLLEFVRSRVAILEVVGDSKKVGVNTVPQKGVKLTGASGKGGEQPGKRLGYRPTSLVTADTDTKCPCCSNFHNLTSCTQFKSWSIEDRMSWTREHKLCLNCFSADHWVPRCKVKSNCNKCSRKHNSLLHSSEVEYRNKDETPSPLMCLCVRPSRDHPLQQRRPCC